MVLDDARSCVDLGAALECMVTALSREGGDDVVLVSTVFDRWVGPADCHLLCGPARVLPSDEVLFNLARQTGAPELLVGSRSAGPITEIHASDLDLFTRLVQAVVRSDLKLLEHVVVAPDGLFRLMGESVFLDPETPR